MLARLRNAKKNGESGFTLIELLVVMIIIGILAAIAIPAFLNQKKKAKETSAKSDATNISKEIAAALVDGNIKSLAVAVDGAAPNYKITWTNADATTDEAKVKVSAENTPTLAGDATTSTGGSVYCVTVTPASSTGASAWSAGPNGLKKGASCP